MPSNTSLSPYGALVNTNSPQAHDDYLPLEGGEAIQKFRVDPVNNAQHFYHRDRNSEAYGYYYNSDNDARLQKDGNGARTMQAVYSYAYTNSTGQQSNPASRWLSRSTRQGEAPRQRPQPIVEEPDDTTEFPSPAGNMPVGMPRLLDDFPMSHMRQRMRNHMMAMDRIFENAFGPDPFAADPFFSRF